MPAAQRRAAVAARRLTACRPAAARLSGAAPLMAPPTGPGQRARAPHRHVVAATAGRRSVRDEAFGLGRFSGDVNAARGSIGSAWRSPTDSTAALGGCRRPRGRRLRCRWVGGTGFGGANVRGTARPVRSRPQHLAPTVAQRRLHLGQMGPVARCGLQAGFESGLLRRVFTRGVSGISDQVCCEFNRAAAVGRGKVFT